MGYPLNDTMPASDNVYLSQLVGLGDKSEEISIAVGNHTCLMTNCRAITCTSGTTIKVDYVNGAGTTETRTIPAELRQIALRNIIKVYQVGTDATNMVIWR